MLEAKAIVKRLGGEFVLRGINLSIALGEVVGLMGMNGSGKTTLLEVLSGKTRPDSGQVWIEGRRVAPSHWFAARLPVFRCYQVPRLFYGLSVRDNFILGHWALDEKGGSFNQYNSVLNLGALADTLSVGQRRRVILDWVSARIGHASYLLLDEPAAGADEALVSILLDLLSHARDRRCGVLLVEHRDSLLNRACDRIVYLHNGVCSNDPETKISGDLPGPEKVNRVGQGVSERSLEVQSISVTRGAATILRNITFQVAAGEIVVITGSNGSGKSSLLRAIYGDPSTTITDGRVQWDGYSLLELSLRQRITGGIHLMPQQGTLFSSMTVEEALRTSIEAAKPGLRISDALRNVCRKFPILDKIRHRRCGLLSGGERRLVSLVRVLLLQPQVALLDEPLAGVDADGRRRVVDIIDELARGGAAVIIAEQESLANLFRADQILSLGQLDRSEVSAA